jgi:hypothetical protein
VTVGAADLSAPIELQDGLMTADGGLWPILPFRDGGKPSWKGDWQPITPFHDGDNWKSTWLKTLCHSGCLKNSGCLQSRLRKIQITGTSILRDTGRFSV